MRIDINLGALNGLQGENVARAGSRQRVVEQPSTEDVAELSCNGLSIADLSGRVMAAPEVRCDRVNELRQQISGGTYQPDPKQIAAAMIDTLLAR